MAQRSPSYQRRVLLGYAAVLGLGAALPAVAHADAKTGRPWLGVSMRGGPAGGVLVDYVFKGSPAQDAELQRADMLVSADGVALDEPRDLVAHIKRRKPGMTVRLRVRRGGRERDVRVELGRHPGSDEINRLMYVGNPAPSFVNPTEVQGSLPTSFAGEVTLVDFFASWCASCRALTPQLSQWHGKFKARGLRVVGMTTDSEQLAKETATKWKIPYAVGSDVTQRTNAVFKVSAIPALFLVDRKGIIRDVMIGYEPGRFAAFDKHIEKLLAQR